MVFKIGDAGSMVKEKVIGYGLIVSSFVMAVVYSWLLFFPPREGVDILIMKFTIFIIVILTLIFVAWIGYIMASAPPAKPVEELESELEGDLEELEDKLR